MSHTAIDVGSEVTISNPYSSFYLLKGTVFALEPVIDGCWVMFGDHRTMFCYVADLEVIQ